MERVTGIEPATITLATWCSTSWATLAPAWCYLIYPRFYHLSSGISDFFWFFFTVTIVKVNARLFFPCVRLQKALFPTKCGKEEVKEVGADQSLHKATPWQAGKSPPFFMSKPAYDDHGIIRQIVSFFQYLKEKQKKHLKLTPFLVSSFEKLR